jgi:hypothetical protein
MLTLAQSGIRAGQASGKSAISDHLTPSIALAKSGTDAIVDFSAGQELGQLQN